MGVNLLFVPLPDMPGHGFDLLGIAGTLPQKWTAFADSRVGTVFPITVAVGRAIGQGLAVGTKICIALWIVLVGAFWEPSLDVIGATITNHTVNFTFFKSF